MKDEPVIEFANQAAWATWLKKHHAASKGIAMRLAKKATGIASITYPEALDVALCYGWIDGLRKSDGASYYTQRFTPRKPKSIWSKVNRLKVAALIEQGRMQPAGLAEIERAKKDGRWDAAYDGPSKATVPEDLQAALDRKPKAKAFFAKLNGQNRYAILFRLHSAKKPETRARRLATFVAMLEKHETLYPQ